MKKQLIAGALCLALLSQTAFAALGPVNRLDKAPAGTVLESPSERVFRIAGSEKEFVLLDANEEETEFFVIAKEVYGNRQYDPNNTQRFDVRDANNIAYWLNNDFVLSGNGAGNILPSEIVNYIDYDHVWITEAGFSGGNCPADYTFQAGLALLSQSEYIEYAGRFGIQDGTANGGWWLRTGRGVQGAAGLILRVGLTGEVGSTAGWDSNYGNGSGVKPVFYLKREFFGEVKLAAEMGQKVKDILKKYYTKEDLRALYSNRQLVDEIGYQPEVAVVAEQTARQDGNVVSQLVVTNHTPAEQRMVLVGVAYDDHDKCQDFRAAEMLLKGKETSRTAVSVPCPADGYVTYFLWRNDGTMEILSNSVTVGEGE